MKKFVVTFVLLVCFFIFDITTHVGAVKCSEYMRITGLENILDYSWNPTGEFILIWNIEGLDTEIYVLDVRSKEIHFLTHGSSPQWLNDEEIVYLSPEMGLSSLCKVNIKSQQVTKITPQKFRVAYPMCISPDKKHLAYLVNEGDLDKLYLYYLIKLIDIDNAEEYIIYAELDIALSPENLDYIVGWLKNRELVVKTRNDILKVIDVCNAPKIIVTGQYRHNYFDKVPDFVGKTGYNITTYKQLNKSIINSGISPDAKYVADLDEENPSDCKINIKDINSGKILLQLDAGEHVEEKDIKWSPEENMLAFLTWKGEIVLCLYDLRDCL